MDLAAALNSIVDGVFVTDASGKLVAVNRAGLRIMGANDLADARSEAEKHRRARNIRSPDGRPIAADCMPMTRALAGEETVLEIEMFDRETHGPVVLRTRTAPIRDAAGAIIGAVKVASDVTHEYELERAKDEFIRAAAHELKTPVTVIKACAAATLSQLDGHEPLRALLDALNRGADRIDRVVSSLLDLCELETGQLWISRDPIPLQDVIGEVLGRLTQSAAARMRFVNDASAEVRGDRRKLRQALQAIVDNALKYSPKCAAVEIADERRDASVVVSVRDHGAGIADDERPRIFEKFYRVPSGDGREVGGLGVGLFVAREIVLQHDGRIWCEDAEGGGTVFFIELPVRESAGRRA